jgi:hypothetical protein
MSRQLTRRPAWLVAPWQLALMHLTSAPIETFRPTSSIAAGDRSRLSRRPRTAANLLLMSTADLLAPAEAA